MEQRGDGDTRVLDSTSRALAGEVGGTGVAVALRPEGLHGLQNLGEYGCRCVGVEINAHGCDESILFGRRMATRLC